jgi:DNA topoisomerase-1
MKVRIFMKLVIVESPGKIKTIQKFLGQDFTVRASVGHCYEIDPTDNNAIDIENGFKVKYSVIKGKKQIVDDLKKIAKGCELTYIATDPDREGENIGWSIATMCLDSKTKIKRISFHEITKSAIQNAIENPGEIDLNLVYAQRARAVLDRLVGYKVSPVLWRYVASKTSAGRVQSVGLRLIVDRQQEIDAFKIEEYWTIAGDFLSLRKDKFTANYSTKEKHKNKEETDNTLESINKVSKWIIKEISKVKRDRMPLPVFQTSTLQQFCSTTFGWPAKKTMSAAQSVYEAGLITYHRTDCTNISQEAITTAREIIKSQFGDKYLPEKPNVYKSKSNAQEAHEGIRPSHLE